MIPSRPERIYLIGICGTAMASLAGMLRESGAHVAGSDSNVYPPMSLFLEKLNVPVYEGFDPRNIEKEKPDLVVIGNALSRGNAEIEHVLNDRIRYASMAEVVKERFIRGKRSVVVAGTHGKTTTTSLLAWLLESAGREPSFLVGGIAENFGSSFKLGTGPDFVIEGDEYDTAFFDKGPKFLHYLPSVVLLKNVEYDHADIYADLDAVKTAFRRLVNLVPSKGVIVAGFDSPVVRELTGYSLAPVKSYGLRHGDWRADGIRSEGGGLSFDVLGPDAEKARFFVPMLGEFNVDNALGSIVAARSLGLSDDAIREGLKTFRSVKRRLEVRGRHRGVTVIDDFAHHPTAVRETLDAVRQAHPEAHIWAIFEPRSQSSRRAVFEAAFLDAFESADRIILAKVFGKLALPPEQILSPERLVEGLRIRGKNAISPDTTEDIVRIVGAEAGAGDQIVIMSNGGFDNIHARILERLTKPVDGL